MYIAAAGTVLLLIAHLIDKRKNPMRAYFLLVLAGMGWFFIALTIIGMNTVVVDLNS